jgi:hypothetical protein
MAGPWRPVSKASIVFWNISSCLGVNLSSAFWMGFAADFIGFAFAAFIGLVAFMLAFLAFVGVAFMLAFFVFITARFATFVAFFVFITASFAILSKLY